MKRILVCLMAMMIVLCLSTQMAKAVGVEPGKDFGVRLSLRQYVGAGFIVPKEGDINVGPSAVYGFVLKDETNKEAAFLDITFSQSGLSSSVLWTRNDVRQIILRLGYKWVIDGHDKWQYGFDLQSQRMNFGSKRLTQQSFGALLEYRLMKKLSVQIESSQFTRKSSIRFGSFQMLILREM